MPLEPLYVKSATQQAGAAPSPTDSSKSGSETLAPLSSPTTTYDHKSSIELTGRVCDDCESILRNLKDPAKTPGVPLPGWPELAQLITKYPDLEAFQPFRDLHIKSLLYYQAELDGLRNNLHDAEWSDHRHANFEGAEDLGKRVDELLRCKYNEGEDRKQLDLIIEIRRVLKEYSEALLLYKQISILPQADPVNVNSLRDWLRNAHGDNIPILGRGSETWGVITKTQNQKPPTWKSLAEDVPRLLLSMVWRKKGKDGDQTKENKLDLVVPRSSPNIDGLTQWVASEGVPFWENVKEWWKEPKKPESLPVIEEKVPSDPSRGEPEDRDEIKSTLTKYSERSILQFTSVVATIVACLLPIAAIAVLSKIHTTGKLLGLIAGFTTLFALMLMLLTDAGTSRVQIFTATAAFAAVLVVFVQNQNQ